MLFNVRYGLLKGISHLLCGMSYDRILSIGRVLGPCIMNRIAKQRNRGIEQMMRGMGIRREEAEKLLHKVYEHIGMSAMEMMYMPRLCKEKDHIDDYVKIDHPEYLEAAYAEGKGIVGLTAHMGNWEWLGAGLALHDYDTSAIGKKQADDALMRIINDYRARVGQHIFLTGTGGYEMIAAARSMKKNHILGFLSDKDGDETGIPVLFMNRVFSFPQGPCVFARKFKAPILPLFIVRNEGGKGHTICIAKPFYYEETGDTKRDLMTNAQKMATIMEDFIKEHPTDWLWFQHLFWTRPGRIKMYMELTEEEKKRFAPGISEDWNETRGGKS